MKLFQLFHNIMQPQWGTADAEIEKHRAAPIERWSCRFSFVLVCRDDDFQTLRRVNACAASPILVEISFSVLPSAEM